MTTDTRTEIALALQQGAEGITGAIERVQAGDLAEARARIDLVIELLKAEADLIRQEEMMQCLKPHRTPLVEGFLQGWNPA